MNITGYEVTGITHDNKWFKRCYSATGYSWAMGINLWNGSVWERYDNGKRKLIKRVFN